MGTSVDGARAIVLAAGKGTRMKSSRPKVLHEICGAPMLWWVLDALRRAGVTDAVVVTSPENDAAIVERFGVPTVVQDPQEGTGHAVRIALDALAPRTGTVVIAYGDMPLVEAAVFEDVLAAVDADAGTALALVTAHMPLPSSFGRIVRNPNGVAKIVEAKDCTPEQLAIDEMNAGIYAYDERALRAAIARVGNDNAQHEYYLTDTIEILLGDGLRVVPVGVDDYRTVLGVNDRIELAAAGAYANRRLCEAHMRSGVTIVDPATTYLEPGAVIGRDTIVHPGTHICGGTTIGERCVVGPYVVIRDSVLADDVRIGPFAQLRSGAKLAEHVHIGNFVEVKKSELAAGVKAGHLTYLGDAFVGENTNIGAGTVTCNYDGANKNVTRIGKDAFIGTNSSLVAPLEIGDNALTGAGSVVTKNVPDGDRVAGVPAKSIVKKPV